MTMENVIRNLKARGFYVSYFDTKEEARDYFAQKLVGKEIGMGGSITLQEMGLYDALSKNNTVWNHWVQEPKLARGKAAQAGVYITSANALADTGDIINIDGAGNRVSATLYGKDEVYFVIGKNKLAENYDKALWRARNIASPKNAQRLHMKTPCAKNADKCYDCQSPQRICRGLVVHWGPLMGVGRTEVVLIGETLGY